MTQRLRRELQAETAAPAKAQWQAGARPCLRNRKYDDLAGGLGSEGGSEAQGGVAEATQSKAWGIRKGVQPPSIR